MRKKNLVGRRFGLLSVKALVGRNKFKRAMWLCICDCGDETIKDGGPLSCGYTKSCGCMSSLWKSKAMEGVNNPQWKNKGGEKKKGYGSLHAWVKRHKKKIELCERCSKAPSFDLANISQKYKRDINDFEWLCRKCHMEKDGRYFNLKQYSGRINQVID